MKKLYYILTALIPRNLPRNESDWDRLKWALTNYFGLPDSDEVWYTIVSHVCSLPLSYPYTKVSYSYLAAVGNKLSVNKTAEVEKAKHRAALKVKFEEKMKADAEQYLKDHPEEVADAKDESPQPTTPSN